jgi:hypothetical protein
LLCRRSVARGNDGCRDLAFDVKCRNSIGSVEPKLRIRADASEANLTTCYTCFIRRRSGSVLCRELTAECTFGPQKDERRRYQSGPAEHSTITHKQTFLVPKFIANGATHNMLLRQLSGRGLTLGTGLTREFGNLLAAAFRSAPRPTRSGWDGHFSSDATGPDGAFPTSIGRSADAQNCPKAGRSPAFARRPCRYRRPHSAIGWERFCASADRQPVILSGPQAAFRLRD